MRDQDPPTEESEDGPDDPTTQLTLAAAVELADESESDDEEVI